MGNGILVDSGELLVFDFSDRKEKQIPLANKARKVDREVCRSYGKMLSIEEVKVSVGRG